MIYEDYFLPEHIFVDMITVDIIFTYEYLPGLKQFIMIYDTSTRAYENNTSTVLKIPAIISSTYHNALVRIQTNPCAYLVWI